MNLSFSPVVAVVTHSGEEAEECTSQFAPSVCMHCPRLHGWRQCASAEQQKSAFDWVQLKGQPSATSANSPPGNPLHPTLRHLLHRLFTPVLFSITSPLLDAACLSVCLPLLLQQLLLLSYCSLAFPLSPAHVFRSTLIRLLPCP